MEEALGHALGQLASDTELTALVNAWADLPLVLKAGILAMVRAVTMEVGATSPRSCRRL